MNQQMHNRSTVSYTAVYYTAPTTKHMYSFKMYHQYCIHRIM